MCVVIRVRAFFTGVSLLALWALGIVLFVELYTAGGFVVFIVEELVHTCCRT